MANTMIYYAYSNMAVSHQKQITFFWETTLIGASNRLKLSVFSWLTRLNTPKTSLFYGGTTSVHPLIVYMGFTTNARGATISSYGKHLPTASTVYRLPQSLTRKFSQCMGVLVRI